MSKRPAKQASKGTACPICAEAVDPDLRAEDAPVNTLRLDAESGKYSCAAGHSISLKDLRLKLESDAKRVDIVPEPSENQAFSEQVTSQNQEPDGVNLPSVGAPESSQSTDTVRILPNGDVAVTVILAEGHAGPVAELAAAEGETVSKWLSGNVELWLNDVFTSSFTGR